jgi:RNA polymerase sigma-70 factor (ECF subfamily)
VTRPTDAELIAEVLAGRTDRFARLVERYQEAMFRHAAGMVGDPDAAADLVQDSFVKAYTHLATCLEPDRFAAWVFRILRNRCMDHLKNLRQRSVPLDEQAAAAGDADPIRGLERTEAARAVERALARLPAAQREAFLLKHVEELSYEEMAERLDASVSALKMRVMRAREALQEMLRGLT